MSGDTFADIFDMNFASISEAVERRREEAVGCAEDALRAALEEAMDRVGLRRGEEDVRAVVDGLLVDVVVGGSEGGKGDGAESEEDTSGSDEDSGNVLIINVDSVRRESASENQERVQESVPSLSEDIASKKLIELTPESISSQDSETVETPVEDRRVELPKVNLSFNGDSSLLNTPENSNDVPEVQQKDFRGEDGLASNESANKETESGSIAPPGPPANGTTEEVDLTEDSDSQDSTNGMILLEDVNANKEDGEETGFDPLEIDDIDLEPASLSLMADLLERPSMRQIATVHPFPIPSSNGAEEEEVEATEVQAAVTTPPRTMLRLRNFAVDPAMQQEQHGDSGDEMAQGSSWHVLDPNSVQEQVEKVTAFSKAMSNLKVRCVIGTKVGLDAKYAILSSDKNVFLKLFVHHDKVAALPTTADAWLNVAFTFYPSGQPKEIGLVFKNASNIAFTAKLPTTDLEVETLIEQSAPFVLSMGRIKKLDTDMRSKKGRPFVRYATMTTGMSRPLAVSLTDISLDLAPLFQHFDGINKSTRVTDAMRQITREHLGIASHHLGKNLLIEAMEEKIFSQSTGNAWLYRDLLPKELYPRPATVIQQRALPLLAQVPILPRVVTAASYIPPVLPQEPLPQLLQPQQPCCPFCFLPFAIRSNQFYEHVATFHYPPLSDPQTCDVAGCSVTFRTRPEHVKHVSEHTPSNDGFFISGLQRLLDYLSDPGIRKEVFAQSDPKFNKSTICIMCKTQVKNMDELFNHLTRTHFYQQILDNVPAQSRGRRCCSFSKCNTELLTANEHVFHVGVVHQVSYRLLSLGKDAAGPKVPLMSCPLQKCSTSNLQGIPSVILHLLTHFVTPLKFEVQKLQKILNVTTYKCPVERCEFVAQQGSPDSLISSVVEHYGLRHSAVIDTLFRYSGEEGLLRSNVDIRMFEEYRSSVIKSPTFDCPICLKNKKKVRYGNEYARLLHLTMAHFSKQLHVMFSASFEQRGPDAGKCSQCGVMLDASERALHVGVMHKKAKEFLTEYLNDPTSANAEAAPQLVTPRTAPIRIAPAPAPIAANRSSVEEITIILTDDPSPPRPSASSVTPLNGFYGCPKCPAKFSVASIESKIAMEKLLYKHVLSMHFANELRAKLKPILPYCPDGHCPLRTQDLSIMVEHVQVHPLYVVNFLQGQLKVNSLTRYYHENSPEPEIVEENAGDPALKQLYDEYKTFCQERSLRLDNCDASFFSVFLSSVGIKAACFSTVEKFLKKIDGMHEKPLSSSSIVSKTLSALRTKMLPAEKVAKRKEEDYEDLRQTFICIKCDRKFMVLNDLINHVSSPTHIGALVGCRYCKFFQKVEHKFDSSRALMRTFVLHGYGKNHLYNRRLFFHATKDQSIRSTELAFINFCEPCGERVDDLTAHVNKKQHIDKVKVINDFVDYCDKRDICPITCTIKDVNFHMESCRQKDINIYQLLFVISRLHDNVEGTELCGIKLVEDKIKELNDRNERSNFNLICYSCPFGAPSLPEMYAHVTSVSHKIAVRSRVTTKANNLVFCELCKMVFKNTDSILTHKYSPVHIGNVNRLASNHDLVPSDKGEAYCYVCDLEDDSGSHSKSDSHRLNAESADLYFNFCKDKAVDPITCRVQSLMNFFNETFGNRDVDNSSIDRAFDVIDRLHLGCGKEPSSIRDDSALLRAVDSLKGSNSSSPRQNTSATLEEAEEEEKKKKTPRSDLQQCEPPYLSSLNKKDIEKVTVCGSCHHSFKHATYLLLHMMHIHSKPPMPFIEKEIKGKKPLNCHKCLGKCSSPLAFALHHDRHQVDKYIHCKMCDKKYYSPNSYYMTDNCRKNSIPASVKNTVDKAIAKVVVKSSQGIIGMLFSTNTKKDEEEDETKSKIKMKRKLESDSDNDDEYDPQQDKESDSISDDEDEDRSLAAMVARNPNLLGPFPKVSVSLKSKMMAEKAMKQGGTIQVGPSTSNRAERLEPQVKPPNTAEDLTQADDDVAMKTPPQNRGTKRSAAAESTLSGPKSVKRSRKRTADAEIIKQCLDLIPTPKRNAPVSTQANTSASKTTPTSSAKPMAAENTSKPIKASNAAKPAVTSATIAAGTKPVKIFTPAFRSRSTTKPGPASRNVKTNPAASTNSPAATKSLASSNSGEYFCLDCEKCHNTSCEHLTHPRKLIGDYDVVRAHMATSSHSRFQPAANFLQVNRGVRLADLAYTKKYGNKVRKQFKKLCLSGTIECRNYEEDKKCRKCDFLTDQVVEMFRHMREKHLK